MKRRILTLLVLTLMMTVLILPRNAGAEGEAHLQLKADQLTVKAGQEIAVQLLVQEATPVYGAEVHLQFDPAVLMVVALDHGSFFTTDPENEAFILQNEANNEAGVIDYALALLNPAPAVKGDGLLLTIVFQAKTAGQATIRLEEGLFGTETGEEIMPAIQSREIHIVAEDNNWFNAPPVMSDAFSSDRNSFSLLLGVSLIGLAGSIGLVGIFGLIAFAGWFWLRHIRQHKRSPQRRNNAKM